MTSTQPAPRAARLIGLVLGIAIGSVLWVAATVHLASPASGPTALSHALEEPDFLRRIARVAAVLEETSPDGVDEMRRIIEAHPATPQDAERILFVEWWTRFAPRAAYAWARRDDIRHGQALVHRVLEVWARTDPLSALALVHRPSPLRAAGTTPIQASGSSWRNEAELAVIAGWDESLVPGLEEWIFDQQDPVKQQVLIQTLARNRVATRGPERTWEWADSFPDPFRRTTRLAVTSAIATRDPHQAARLIQPLVEAGDETGLIVRLGTQWCKHDPKAALAWIIETPETTVRPEAILECVRSWIGEDRDGYIGYIESRPDPFPEWLAPSLRLYARTLESESEFVRGLALMDRLADERLASRAAGVMLRRWLERDRVAATSWIEAHPVSEETLRRAGYPGGGQPPTVDGGASDPRS